MTFRPVSLMIFLPSSTLVPSRRTTSGTFSPTSFTAAMTPSAMTSQLHDAAEDVDQDALHVGVGGDDLEGRGDLLPWSAAADVEEVGRLVAVELDDVHGGHGQARAVDHAADRRRRARCRLRSNLEASISFGSSSVSSRRATMSGWRNRALPSNDSLASSTRRWSSAVTISGLISEHGHVLGHEGLEQLLQQDVRPPWPRAPVRPSALASVAACGSATRRSPGRW